MAVKILTPPAIEPITLTEAKLHCRVDVDDDDALITALISAAREWVELFDGRAYLTQTLELWLPTWTASGMIDLPKPPLQSVTTVEYYDQADHKWTLDSGVYFVDTVREPGRLQLRDNQTWPATSLRTYNAICVTYKAGATTAAAVPQRIKQAILLLVGHWYENREASTVGAVSREIDFSVKALIRIDRLFEF